MIQKIKAAFDTDDRAVSPVIGVILMVAITVILAAVIASMTLGLGDSAQTAPTAKFDFDQSGEGADANVTISHASGANIDAANLNVTVDGSPVADVSQFDGTVSAGSSVTLTDTEFDGTGNVIRVTWTSEDGGSSSTLATYTVQ